VVSVPEIFNYWLQPGRIDIGFLGAAQLDRIGNINTTVNGPSYDEPAVRLPGAGGAPEIAAACKEVVVVLRQSLRTFAERLDFVTSVGFGDGAGARQRLGLAGGGPRLVITDLGVLRPDQQTCELVLTGIYAGVTVSQVRDSTGWDLKVSAELTEIPPPTEAELAGLRDLLARTSLGASPSPASTAAPPATVAAAGVGD
jgi:glutaconate CoA-transferase subunit B